MPQQQQLAKDRFCCDKIDPAIQGIRKWDIDGTRGVAMAKVFNCLRNDEEMTAKHDVKVDDPAAGCRSCKAPSIFQKFFYHYKLVTSKIWGIDDETIIKITKEWRDLYSISDKNGNTIDFLTWTRHHLKK